MRSQMRPWPAFLRRPINKIRIYSFENRAIIYRTCVYLDETLCSCQGPGRSREGPQGRMPDGTRRVAPILLELMTRSLPRKEVIQPHVPVRLPCYDFTPLTLHTFDASSQKG